MQFQQVCHYRIQGRIATSVPRNNDVEDRVCLANERSGTAKAIHNGLDEIVSFSAAGITAREAIVTAAVAATFVDFKSLLNDELLEAAIIKCGGVLTCHDSDTRDFQTEEKSHDSEP